MNPTFNRFRNLATVRAWAAVVIAAWLLNGTADATDFTWVGQGNSSSWGDPFNWFPRDVPARTDVAIFNSESPSAVIRVEQNHSVGTVWFTGDSDYTLTTGSNGTGNLQITNELLYDAVGTLSFQTPRTAFRINSIKQTEGVIKVASDILFEGDVGALEVQQNGTFRLQGNANLLFYGQSPGVLVLGDFGGNGTINLRGNHEGIFRNAGRVAPGASPGMLIIEGDYIQTPEGLLDMEINSTNPGEFDQLVVNGDVTLAGNVDFDLSSDFGDGEFVQFMQVSGSQTGQFNQVSTTGNNMVFMAMGSSSYFDAESYNLGDMDRDHDYDRNDIDAMVTGLRDQLAYLILTVGVPLWESGDVHPSGSPDGDFDFDDVAELVNLGLYPAPGSASSSSLADILAADTQIPEPSAGLLLVIGLALSASRPGWHRPARHHPARRQTNPLLT